MRIAVALSGGVDSTTTAHLLLKEGHDVVGITAQMFKGRENEGAKVLEKAKRSADGLGIKLHTIDITEEFQQKIIDPFCSEYLSGKTPSPCIRCNRFIKFGTLLKAAEELGFEKIATGHYARIKEGNGRYYISRAADFSKDQSYFLFGLEQEQLSRIVFPLSEFTKNQVREIAFQNNLPAAQSKESQEICFIPDNDYKHYLEQNSYSSKAGEIVDTEGNVLGSHNGIHRYTIGQRRGLGISHTDPLYVVDIVPELHQVVAGTKEHLYKKGLIAGNITLQKASTFDGDTVYAKIRSTHKPVEAKATILEDNKLELLFQEKTMQISPGQAAVLYDSDGNILGGAWIERSIE